MYVSVNKVAKGFLQQKFKQWYSEKVAEQLGDGDDNQQSVQPVDLTASMLKTLGVK